MMEPVYVGLIKTVLLLAAMVCVAMLFYRFMGKWQPGRGMGNTGGYDLRKAATIHLGYRKLVSVVEGKNHVLVLGVGDKG
jgi:flagellar biogenesis protein FliO